MFAVLRDALRSRSALIGAFAVMCAGGATAQDSVEFTDVMEFAATVTAIDQAQRLVTIRGPEGNEVTLEAGPEVRNLAQVEAGDVVRITFEETYMARRISPEEAPEAAAAVTAAAALAEEGERPGVAFGAAATVVVMIESIGPDGRTATFITPDGAIEAIYVLREQSRAFARTLETGDLVQLTQAGLLAVVVEPLSD
jgi:hypothetical protein